MINKRYLKSSFLSGKDKVLRQMGKIGSNRILMNITDSFAMLIPILIAGSVAVIARVFIFSSNDSISSSILGWIGLAHSSILNGKIETLAEINNATQAMGPVVFNGSVYAWNPNFDITNGQPIYVLVSSIGSNIFVPLQVAAFDHIALFTLMAISFNIARQNNSNSPILSVIVGVISLMIISGGSDGFLFWDGKNLPLDASRLLPAMFSGFVFVSIFEWLSKNKKMHIKMVAGVPPAVSNSFAKLFPAMITLLIALGVNGLFSGVSYFAGLGGTYSLAQGISDAIQAPFFGIISNKDAQLGLGIFYVTFVSILWFFGLHGTNVLGGVFSPILLAGTLQNEAAKGPGGNLDNITVISAGTFDSFVFFGGAGATLALLLATLVISQRKAARDITIFGGPPAIFNINEPIIFGYPIVLNFSLFIPFFANQIVLFIITYLAIIEFKWVPATSVIIPWTSPVGIGAFLATQSWEGIILAFLNLAIAVAIYIPFIMLANKRAKMKGEELVNPYAKFKRLKANLNS